MARAKAVEPDLIPLTDEEIAFGASLERITASLSKRIERDMAAIKAPGDAAKLLWYVEKVRIDRLQRLKRQGPVQVRKEMTPEEAREMVVTYLRSVTEAERAEIVAAAHEVSVDG